MKQTNHSGNYNSGGLINNHKKLPHLEVIIAVFMPLLVVVSVLLFKFAFDFSMDSDPLWSIGVGEWINIHRTVPYVDVFSWTVAGEEWFSNSWLYCWLMYLADQSMGYLGIALIIFIPCLITGYFIYFMCKKFHDSAFAIILTIAGIFVLIIIAVQPRAYIYTFAFVAAIMFLIRFKRDTWLIYFIPVIFLIWANIQSSFRFGFTIIFIEALVGTIFYKEKKLWPVVGLSFLATLINPYGFSFWNISFAGFFTPGTQFITEWEAPDFNSLPVLLIYSLMFLTGLFSASRLKDEISSKVYDRDKIMIFFWFLAAFIYALTTVRAFTYVLLLWAPLFASFATRSQGESRFLKPISLILVVFLLIISLTGTLPLHSLEIDSNTGRPVSFVNYLQSNQTLNEQVPPIFPIKAVAYLKESPEMLDRLFNSYMFGGYLLLNNIEVFIDARESVFTRQSVTENYASIIRMEVNPDLIIEKYDINTFLLSNGERLAYYLDLHPDWEKKYEDDVAVIYSKSGLH